MFTYPPTPAILQWLSQGQFPSRLHRSVRMWLILDRLYGGQFNWVQSLSQPFRYSQLRDRLFSLSHSKGETLSAQELTVNCSDPKCLCHQSLSTILSHSNLPQSLSEWVTETSQRTGLSVAEIQTHLDDCPFATVHRSLRDDLTLLASQGWLKHRTRQGYYSFPPQQLPKPPIAPQSNRHFEQLSSSQKSHLIHILESVAFVQPDIDIAINTLWEELTESPPNSSDYLIEQNRRIFLHFDYILSSEIQEKVDDWQQQIESLWYNHDGGIIQFKTWVARENRVALVTVYPVCLHYARRAKYLSAYGVDPWGEITWHNYRLDRIMSPQLRILSWDDPAVPQLLKKQHETGTLPNPGWIEEQLEEAWGFNFYLPKALLIMRFPVDFASNYVDDTVRHSTFQKIPYSELFSSVETQINNREERQLIQKILRQRSPDDAYYQAWVRVGDINIVMRLRDWRPQGEIIAPVVLRQQMWEEVEAERLHYGQDFSN